MTERDLEQVRAELARVRAQLRRVTEGADLGRLLEEEQRLRGEEWILRGGGLELTRAVFRLRGGRTVLAPPEARRGAAEAFARVLRGRYPGTAWDGKTDQPKEN